MEIPKNKAYVIVNHDGRINRVYGDLGMEKTLREIYDRKLLVGDEYRAIERISDQGLETIMQLFQSGGAITTDGRLVATSENYLLGYLGDSIKDTLSQRRVIKTKSSKLTKPFPGIHARNNFILFSQGSEQRLNYYVNTNGSVFPGIHLDNKKIASIFDTRDSLAAIVEGIYARDKLPPLLPSRIIAAQSIVEIANNWGQGNLDNPRI